MARHEGLLILVAPLTASKQLLENESCYLGRNEMAGLKGKSGPPGNMNAFKHGGSET